MVCLGLRILGVDRLDSPEKDASATLDLVKAEKLSHLVSKPRFVIVKVLHTATTALRGAALEEVQQKTQRAPTSYFLFLSGRRHQP